MSKLKVSASEVPGLVAQYNPRNDPRVWESMARLWQGVAADFIDVAAGYCHDGRPLSELLHRLRTEMKNRLEQQESEFKTAVEKFERNAHEAVYNQIVDERVEAITAGNRELEQARAEAVGRAQAADAKRREDRYQADLKEAERRRAGGVTNPAFFG